MERIKDHLIGKILVLTLSITLVLPLFVKLNHLFEDHKHEVCKTPFTNHFHEYEIDCEFYEFTLNTNFYSELDSFEIIKAPEINNSINSRYHFISDYQQLSFSLRGPPLSA